MKIEEKIIELKTGEKALVFSPDIQDAQGLADHANKVFAETRNLVCGPEDGIKTAEHEIKLIEGIKDANRSFIAAVKINDKIVALGDISQKSKSMRMLHVCGLGISIQKEYWGKGIGNKLMEVMIENAKKLDYEMIELSVVKGNDSAHHLYQKFGFKEWGTYEKAFKYTDGTYADLIFMNKEL